MMEGKLLRSDKLIMPCYLETSEPDNIPYYEQFGFTPIHRYQINRVDVFCLFREPDSTIPAQSMKRKVTVNDLMQTGYVYYCTEQVGSISHRGFSPELTPGEMLEMGVFGGKYMTDCQDEFPVTWFTHARLCHERHEPELNYFGVNASQPLSVWRRKGWIYHEDPRGWFQWYCRYYQGRRCPDDERQIKRWKAMKRHIAQLKKHCRKGDWSCRPRQRQALLNWGYDSRKL
jgi:hypothetical protein